MDLLPDDEQAEVAAVSAAFLDDRLPTNRLFDLDGRPEVVDPSLWAAIADLGWFGLGLGESDGGVGYTLAEETLLFHQIGRHVGPTNLLATVLAVHAAAGAGADDVRDALLGGEAVAASAVARHDGRHDLFDVDRAQYVLAADVEGAVVYTVDSIGSPEPVDCTDDTVSLVRADLGAATQVAAVSGADLYLRGAVLTSAMLSGIADAARDDSVAYALEREQFGKAIGTFQAVKHRCADMAVRSEMAYTQVLYAALALRDDLADAADQVGAAKVVAGDTARENASSSVQVHGGYGYTTEYRPHFYVKRTDVLSRFFGDERAHLAALVG